MPNFPLSGKGKNQEKLRGEDILELSSTPGKQEIVETREESQLSLPGITHPANIKPRSTETSKSLDFPALRLQASLVAGSLGGFKSAKGARVKSETVTLLQPNGKRYKAIRIFLAVDENDIEVVESTDGVDFAVNGYRMIVDGDSGK